jgi:hypothetical protein
MKKHFLLVLLVTIMPKIGSSQYGRTLGSLIFKSFAEGFFSAGGEDAYNSAFNNKRVEDLYAQYPELREELDDIKTDLEEHDSRISTLESDMKDVNSKLALLDTRIDKIEESLPYGSYSIGTGIGTFQGIKYTQFHSLANLHIGSGSIGLFLKAHNIGISDEILSRDKVKLINIVPYIKFGSEEDKAYVNFGSMNTSGFGYSYMFRNYSNDLVYSERKFGVKGGVNSKVIGLDIFNSDISNPGIFAGSLHLKPLGFLNNILWFNRINLGYSYITDTRPLADKIKIDAYDLTLPLYATEIDEMSAVISMYGNYASINKYGTGYGYGLNLNAGRDGLSKHSTNRILQTR